MRPLRLEYRNSVLRPPAAWLIAGGDAAAWLAEITRWGIDDSRCRLHVLPRSAHDLAPSSVLVATGGQVPRAVPAAAPFGAVAGKIFLPVDAALLPAATDAELAAFAPCSALIFHPTLGAVACERVLAVGDLLRVSVEVDEPFAEVAAPRLAYPRIETIGFRVQESLGEMLGAMSDGIGSEPLAGLEPAADEPSASALAQALRKLRGAALRAGQRLIPQGGTAGGAFGKMREWVEQRLRSMGSELDRVRNREIHRLLDKLRDDPDEALRHALPLASQPGRGLAPPSAHLSERRTDFNLGNLRGGGPSDAWNLDHDLQRQLRENYVRIAERERQLGRFRRSAYIYAELLRDLASAALVLKEGRHWREAALLYRDHLGKPMDAARCFVEARMPAEAVTIFEKERAWEELGELHLRLGENFAAESVFRKWVGELLKTGQTLTAAEVLIERLNARDRALGILAGAWPGESHRDACVKRLFDLHGEAGEHTAASDAIGSLFAKVAATFSIPAVPDWLVHVARKYPDRAVRLLAEDTGRQRIARRLPCAMPAERKRLISCLNDLVSEDRLLPRDVLRYLDASPSPLPGTPRKAPAHDPGQASVSLHCEHSLPGAGTEWTAAVRGERCIMAAGFVCGVFIRACRMDFDGETNAVMWKVADRNALPRLILAAPGPHLSHTFFAAAPGEPLKVMILIASRRGDHSDNDIGTPTWAEDVVDAAMGTSALWLLRASLFGWTVSGHRSDGSLVGQFVIDPELKLPLIPERPPGWRPSLVACHGDVVVSYFHAIVVFRARAGSGRQVIECDSTILGLVSGPRWPLPHVAIVMADGVDICWLSGVEPAVFPAIRDLATQPVAGFSTDGILVVIAGAAGYLIEGDSHGRRKVSRFAWNGTTPVAILPGSSARMFTVVERAGKVTMWQFSVRTA